MTVRDRLLGVTVAVLWGVNFLAIHAGLQHFPPFFFAALRFTVMAIPVILLVPRPAVPWRWLLLYGTGFGFAQFAFLFWAMDAGMPTGLASLVLQSSAPFTVLLGVALLGERMSRLQLVGIVVAVAGMVVIGIDRATRGSGAALVPVLLTLAAGFGWAVGNLGSRQARPDNPMHLALWMTVIPPIPFLALSAAVEGPTAGVRSLATVGTSTGLLALAGLAYIVVLGTAVGSGVWTYLMSRYPASRVAPFSLLVPVVGISASWALLGERPTIVEVIGAVIVIGGCLAGTATRSPAGTASKSLAGTATTPLAGTTTKTLAGTATRRPAGTAAARSATHGGACETGRHADEPHRRPGAHLPDPHSGGPDRRADRPVGLP